MSCRNHHRATVARAFFPTLIFPTGTPASFCRCIQVLALRGRMHIPRQGGGLPRRAFRASAWCSQQSRLKVQVCVLCRFMAASDPGLGAQAQRPKTSRSLQPHAVQALPAHCLHCLQVFDFQARHGVCECGPHFTKEAPGCSPSKSRSKPASPDSSSSVGWVGPFGRLLALSVLCLGLAMC